MKFRIFLAGIAFALLGMTLSPVAFGSTAKSITYVLKSGAHCKTGYAQKTITSKVKNKTVKIVECVLKPTAVSPATTTTTVNAAPASTTTTIAPVTTTSTAPATTTTIAAVHCTPLSNSGTCYEPGEFCRSTDHGLSGIAGDGKAIVCADNDGWRWEPK